MVRVFLILISFIALRINLNAPANLSNTSPYILIIEHIAILLLSYILTIISFNKSKESHRNSYYCAFLLSYIISLIILHFLWTPWLAPNAQAWGFDPQRYYIYAQEISIYGYTDIQLNGMGVVYFYATLMKIFGIDPLIPLFFNSLLTYFAILTFSVYLSKNNPNFLKYGWLLVLIPEFIYFNIMSCRDILCMAFMSICVTKLADYSKVQDKILLFISFILLFYIRPTMALPLVLAQLSILFFRRKARFVRFVYFLIFVLLIFWGERIEGVMSSGNDTNLQTRIEAAANMDDIEIRQSNTRTVALLIPHNPIEYVVFGFIRSFLYVIPSPSLISSPIASLSMKGKGQAPGLPNMTTILLFLSVPIFLKLVFNIKSKNSDIQLFLTTTILYFLVIGTFNKTIIHPRYRVVYDLLFLGLTLWQLTVTSKRNSR